MPGGGPPMRTPAWASGSLNPTVAIMPRGFRWRSVSACDAGVQLALGTGRRPVSPRSDVLAVENRAEPVSRLPGGPGGHGNPTTSLDHGCPACGDAGGSGCGDILLPPERTR